MLFSFSLIFSLLDIFTVLQCAFLIFHVFSDFVIFQSSSGCFSFSMIFSFIAIFHVLQWTFINFPPFFSFPHHISCPKGCISHFPWFSVFSPNSRSYSVHFSFSTFFSVSRHNAGPTVYFSHFSRFSVLLAIFHIIQCAFLIFHLFTRFSGFLPYSMSYNVNFLFFTSFSVSRHNPGPTVCIPHFLMFFSVSCQISYLRVCFLFSMIISFLAILQVI